MDQETFQRATDLGICLKCMCLFISGKNVAIILVIFINVFVFLITHLVIRKAMRKYAIILENTCLWETTLATILAYVLVVWGFSRPIN
jgi:hypothetical protein